MNPGNLRTVRELAGVAWVFGCLGWGLSDSSGVGGVADDWWP